MDIINYIINLMENTITTSLSPPLDVHLNRAHLRLLGNMLKKGYASQVLLCSNLPLSIRIPALLQCKLYEEVAIEIMNKDKQTPLNMLWLVVASHAIGMDYEEYYSQLEEKHKEIADDWIQMNKALHHPQ